MWVHDNFVSVLSFALERVWPPFCRSGFLHARKTWHPCSSGSACCVDPTAVAPRTAAGLPVSDGDVLGQMTLETVDALSRRWRRTVAAVDAWEVLFDLQQHFVLPDSCVANPVRPATLVTALVLRWLLSTRLTGRSRSPRIASIPWILQFQNKSTCDVKQRVGGDRRDGDSIEIGLC